MVPSLVTQMIVLFKDTSLASIIGYVDLTKAAQIVNNREISRSKSTSSSRSSTGSAPTRCPSSRGGSSAGAA